ncbi:MAG TPA: hypothetical protein EYN91_04325 [Candidatus Melainabacteria bacterium]|nr:hypothetical protein [Candidatus Melainabacteria bacterium]HIN66169.1 hypothetical protein [Candidatus Obscuribacterales bacterium]
MKVSEGAAFLSPDEGAQFLIAILHAHVKEVGSIQVSCENASHSEQTGRMFDFLITRDEETDVLTIAMRPKEGA